MPRLLIKFFRWLFWRFLVAAPIAVVVAFLATHYLFQEPAMVTWSRLLKPAVQEQAAKYPAIRFAFDILDSVLVDEDPRDRFGPTGDPPAPDPSHWTAELVGPRISDTRPSQAVDDVLVVVQHVTELMHALDTALPGTTILLRPGSYPISGRSIMIERSGNATHPIVLRASVLGDVRLEFNLVEGFQVRAAHWTFENLIIEGTCGEAWQCEHAFHIVGGARGIVLRNNWITNFNSAVKVNGARGAFPDGDLIERNFIVNDGPRDTSSPVTPLDIVAVSDWRVRKNVIADFAKAHGNRISYGAFYKGGGAGNIFEQNLIRCEWGHHGGIRVGISFGGGGTNEKACRDGHCEAEQNGGILRNNIIMNCPNDVGVYLNKSAETLIHNNLIANTRGIDVRFAESDALIVNNVIDGRIFARDGGSYAADHNVVGALEAVLFNSKSADLYVDPINGNFHGRNLEPVLGKGRVLENAGKDLCDQAYSRVMLDIGPMQYGPAAACADQMGGLAMGLKIDRDPD